MSHTFDVSTAVADLDAKIASTTDEIATLTATLDSLTASRDALAALDNDVINNALRVIADLSTPTAPAHDADTQKGRIANMLAANVKPADIARELNTHVSYVYTVRRALRDAA